MRTFQNTIAIRCLRISKGKDSAVAEWTASFLTGSGLIVSKGAVLLYSSGTNLDTCSRGIIREVEIWRVGTKWHAKLSGWISVGIHALRANIHAKIGAIVSPLGRAISCSLDAFLG